jgi:hypothetical protein
LYPSLSSRALCRGKWKSKEDNAVRNLKIPVQAAAFFALALLIGLGACEPTVKVEAPQEPITINLNIKLDADVRVRLEEKAEEDVDTNPIF